MIRRFCVVTHKYLGLFLGLLLSITGISGSLIVFDRELDEILAPHTASFEPAATMASLDRVLNNAVAAVDNGTMPTRIALGRDSSAPHIVRFPAVEDAPGPLEVSINPGTGEVLAIRNWGEYAVTWFYHLHLSFLGGARGELLVGIMGIALAFFCLSGIVIWWPKAGRWRRALTIKTDAGAYRLNFDLHKTIGLYFLPVLLMLALTGIEIVWHEPVERVVAAVLPVTESAVPRSLASSEPDARVDAIADSARSVYPQARIARIYFPRAEDDPYQVTFIHPEETWNEYARTSVYVDRSSASVLGYSDGREQAPGNVVLDWVFPLHNGDGLGIVGRWLVFFAGLMPAVLFGTGIYMWWRKRKSPKLAI